MSDKLDKAIQAKQREKLETEKRLLEKKGLKPSSSEDPVLRRLRSEMKERSVYRPIELSTETLLGENFDRKSINRTSEQIVQEVREVEKLNPSFSKKDEINQHSDKAWAKLSESEEGKVLLREAGGKDNIIKSMDDHIHKFVNRTAYYSERTNELSPDAVGRNVHRAAELYHFEKDKKKILDGKLLPEQRIDYLDQNGDRRFVKIDYLYRSDDGRLHIKDYKRINLGEYERTPEGKKWVDWAKENIGKDLREKIQNGESPFFTHRTHGKIPAEIQSDLREYLYDCLDKYKIQMEKYKFLVSEAAGVELSKVGYSFHPYFSFV
mgnify:FL=1